MFYGDVQGANMLEGHLFIPAFRKLSNEHRKLTITEYSACLFNIGKSVQIRHTAQLRTNASKLQIIAITDYSLIILSLALTVSIFLKTARALLRELLGKLTNSSLRTLY